MSKKVPTVGILGNPSGVLTAGKSVDLISEYVGENTGNLLFQYAMWKIIRNPTLVLRMGVDFDLEFFKQNIDVLCIPAANQINPSWDLVGWADLVEYIDKPVIIAGLGAQAEIGKVGDICLQAGTKRFLDAVSERSKLIGVRGSETKALLDHLGYPDTIVTGCPSNFINDELRGRDIQDKLDNLLRMGNISVNYVFGTMEEFSREYEKILFLLSLKHSGSIVFQTGKHFMKLLNNEVLNEEDVSDLNWQKNQLQSDTTLETFTNIIKDKGVIYYDPKTWIDSASKVDLTIGLRIHGTVASIQGLGVGICVPFDSRTLELATTMGYPHVTCDGVLGIESIQDLLPKVYFSPDDFDRKRESLRSSLKTCLEHFGVETSL